MAPKPMQLHRWPESGHDGWMERGRIVQIRAVVQRHPLVSVVLFAMSVVGGYDTFSGQVAQLTDWQLPSLHALAGRTMDTGGHLFPWWGWLMALLVTLNVALIWQRRPGSGSAQSPTPAPVAAPTPIRDDAAIRRVAAALMEGNRKKIVRDWSQVSSLELYQAACLWAEELPPRVSIMPISEAALARLEMLRAAVIDGAVKRPPSTIGALERYGGKVEDSARVTRESLIQFAEAKGERPLFLFPDQFSHQTPMRSALPPTAAPERQP